MPPRVTSHIPSMEQMIDTLRSVQSEVEERKLARQLEHTTPRELYEAKGISGGLNIEVVDGLVNFALGEHIVEPDFPVRQIGVHGLVDGWCLMHYDAADAEPEFVCSNTITDVQWKGSIKRRPWFIREEYEYEKKVQKPGLTWEVNGPDAYKIEKWCYEAEYTEVTPKDGPVYWNKWWHDYPEGKKNSPQFPPKETQITDFVPFKGTQWTDHRPILDGPVKLMILRYAASLLEIQTANRRFAQNARVYKDVNNFRGTLEDVFVEGREKVSKDGDVFYPDPHADSVRPMFDELDKLEQRIRETTGYVKVARLHNSSGTAREFEYWPLERRGIQLREFARDFLETLYGKELKLHFPPLLPRSTRELVEYQGVLEIEQGKSTITSDERRDRMRVEAGFPVLK